MRYKLTLIALSVAMGLSGQAKPSLSELIDEALQNNLTLIAQRYNIPVAEARILQARLRPNPTLYLQMQYLDAFRQQFSAEMNPAGPPEGDIGVLLPIVRGGKREARIETATSAKQGVEADVLDAARNLILDVQMAFVEFRRTEDQMQLYTESQRALEQVVAINRKRFAVGDIARVELVRSQVALVTYRNEVLQAAQRFRQARFRLQSIVGRREPTNDFDVDGEFRRDATVAEVGEFVKRAIENRPDLISLRRDADRARAFLKLQVAMAKPDWGVQAWYNRQWNIGIKNGSSLTFQWNVPLPVRDRNQGEIARAQQEVQQAEARIRAMEQAIRHEVAQTYAQYRNANEVLTEIERDLLTQAMEVRATTEYSYRRGEATLIEFLDAQRAFTETKLAFADAGAGVARSLYLLDSLAGSGRP